MTSECKFKFDEKNPVQINGGINDKYACECKKRHYGKKIVFGILLAVVVVMENI